MFTAVSGLSVMTSPFRLPMDRANPTAWHPDPSRVDWDNLWLPWMFQQETLVVPAGTSITVTITNPCPTRPMHAEIWVKVSAFPKETP